MITTQMLTVTPVWSLVSFANNNIL